MTADCDASVRRPATSTSGWGAGTCRNRRLGQRLAGSDEWDEFESKVAARPLPGGLGNEDVFCTRVRRRVHRHVVPLLRPRDRAVVDLLGGHRRPGLLDPPVIGSFSGDTGVFEGDDTFEGRPIRVRFIWSGVDDAHAALGAGVLRRRRRDLGDELDHGLHARAGESGVSALEQVERRPSRVPAHSKGGHAPRAEPRARRRGPQVVRHRSGRRAGPARDPSAGAREPP